MGENGLIAVIGDVHGCINTLESLYGRISEKAKSVFSVGDLVDRGKYAKETVGFCLEKNIKCVRGNHEDILLRALENPDERYNRTGFSNFEAEMSLGGKATVYSYLKHIKTGIPSSFNIDSFDRELFTDFRKNYPAFIEEMRATGHLDFIKSFPLKYEFRGAVITHAGIVLTENANESIRIDSSGNLNLDGVDDYSLMWNRDIPSDIGKFQIYGHTPLLSPDFKEYKYIDIDTGCVYGNRLTSVIVNSVTGTVLEVVSVPCDSRDR